jgi:hypothetical protein
MSKLAVLERMCTVSYTFGVVIPLLIRYILSAECLEVLDKIQDDLVDDSQKSLENS